MTSLPCRRHNFSHTCSPKGRNVWDISNPAFRACLHAAQNHGALSHVSHAQTFSSALTKGFSFAPPVAWMLSYNEERPHSSLENIPPAEFKRRLLLAENSSLDLCLDGELTEQLSNQLSFDGRTEAAAINQPAATEAARLRMVSTVVTRFFRDMDRRLEEMKPKY